MIARAATALAVLATSLAVSTAASAGASAATTTRTFETDPVGAVPAGCIVPSGRTPATVSDQIAYSGAHSLRVYDPTSTAMTEVDCPIPAQEGVDLQLRAYPAALPNGFIVDVRGELQGIAGEQPVFHVLVDGTGAIRWYDGSAWTPVAPAGTVPQHQWSLIGLSVPSDQERVHVSVDGRWVGDGGPWGVRPVAQITGFGFTSDGTAAVGDDVYVDDVSVSTAVDTPPPGSTGPLHIADPVVVDEASTPLQMPNTAVVVPHANGQRVIVSYPAHADDSAGAGNRYAYSDDGGATWVRDQASNPMPDAPSYNMTRLRNGDLLATDYHTYMTPGSNNLQAEVDTAISHDNGATWISRVGSMSTPQQMRPISTLTDRPGVPLGGFVLVHSVVEDPDGTLYQSAYGYYDGDVRYRQLVLVSHDEGLTWTTRATVAVDPTIRTEGYCEGAIERVADGSLLIVMRIGSYQPMYYSRSTDNGATWSAPRQLLAGPQQQAVISVYPTLTLLPGGPLVLLVGRPGLAMLVSPDGSGRTWTRPVELDYQNSANGTFVPTDSSHLLVFGDRGANWNTPTPATYEVWSRAVTVEKGCTRTISGNYRGPLAVGAGGLCLSAATVDGPIRITGGTLSVQNSVVTGPIAATGAATVALCGSTVTGPVSVSGSTGPVVLGDSTRACTPDIVHGPVQLAGNTGRIVIDRTVIDGPLSLTGNGGPVPPIVVPGSPR